METVEKLAEALMKAGVILPPVRTCTPAPSATLDRMSARGWISAVDLALRDSLGMGGGQGHGHGHAGAGKAEHQQGGPDDLHGFSMESAEEKRGLRSSFPRPETILMMRPTNKGRFKGYW
jgi:hypothetical protein